MKTNTRIALIYIGFLLLIVSIAVSIFGIVISPSVPTSSDPYGYRFDGIFLGMILLTLAIMFAFYYKYEEIAHETLSK
ncbi:hypothetical protein [Caldisphaera sp.]|uniref:hypothetical protein n=1 Tax=Caldisphaera sp. TaxID=2060322 RepID=UPI0025C1F5F7|nr:hypothetical protein [Caldisphaera sp.]